MRLFGRRAETPARPALVRAPQGIWGGGVVGGEWPRSYEQQVRDAYLGNAIAQRAVRIVAEGTAGVPVYAATGPEQAVGLVAPVLVEAITAQLLLHGNAFVQIVTDSAGAPAALYALRPERVTIEQHARGWPVAYLYRAGDAVTRIVALDGAGRPGLVHLKSLHPTDDLYGAGSLGAASAAVAVHNAAGRWNKALLDNAARPSGALVYGGGEVLSRDQFARLKAEMEAGFAGAGNAGRPMLLEGGLSWQAMSLTPADMDFAGLKAGAAREIALAFGVPPMLLGLPGD
jgi:HK97 family phage portal protein